MSCSLPQSLSSRVSSLFRSSTSSTLAPKSLLSRTTVRHESTARRLTKRLRIPPSVSYGNSKDSTISHDHIVFNPPSSAPNVYHTPLIFLPKTDKRKAFYKAAQASSSAPPTSSTAGTIAQTATGLSTSSTPLAENSTLPPPVRQPYQKKYHLTEKDIDEIRHLRTTDPRTWTRVALAKKFNCSVFFIGLVAHASKEVREEQKKQLEEIRKRWGRKKLEAKEDRARRRDAWRKDL